MAILMAIAFLIGTAAILRKLVEAFVGADAEPMSYWDSFAWLAAPRVFCRIVFMIFSNVSHTTQTIVWAILFYTLVPLALRLGWHVPLPRAVLIAFLASVLLMFEVVLALWK